MNTPTDIQLKQALATMLPELLAVCTNSGADDLYLELIFKYPCEYRNTGQSPKVLDTELLHLCWLIEETLSSEGAGDEPVEVCGTQVMEYLGVLAADTEFQSVHATWQQRALALSKVLGVEI